MLTLRRRSLDIPANADDLSYRLAAALALHWHELPELLRNALVFQADMFNGDASAERRQALEAFIEDHRAGD